MERFNNIRVWKKDEEGVKVFLQPTGQEGVYRSTDGETEVRLTIVERDGMKAVYVDAECSYGHFHSDYAVGFCASEVQGLSRYLANHLTGPFWCSSTMGSVLEKLPADTQGMIYEQECGKYSLLLPVCDEVYKCTMFGDGDGINIALSSYYHALSKIEHSLALIIASEEDSPYKLVARGANYAFDLLGTGCHTREQKRYPEILDYLGWCSWDAMQIEVSEEGLLEKCKEFQEKNIPVKWAMIDDMWADCRDLNHRPYRYNNLMGHMHSCMLSSFEADKVRFPKGLKHCVQEINRFGIEVGMWHPTNGYWKGFDPEGEIAKKFGDCLMTVPNGSLVPKMERDKIFKLYDAFHQFFRECGVEFVKVDNQSFLKRNYQNVYPIGVAARELHAGLEASVGANFDNRMINCMCMASENMWNRPTSSITRCSGDFQPENREWFRKHILQCVYSSLFQGEFYWSDFDMWWTDDAQAGKNSLLRAISGGPIYVSDKIGRTNGELLTPLIYDDGRILRCDQPARPTKDSMFYHPAEEKIPLEIQNTCSEGRYGMVAAYNINEKNCAVRGRISPSDVEGLDGEEFAVYEYRTGKVHFLKRDESFAYTLKNQDDYKLFLISPFDEDGVAMLGRLDKFMAGAVVMDKFKQNYHIYEGGEIAFVNRGRKKFTAVCESGEYEVSRKGALCTFVCQREDHHMILK